MKKLLFDSPLIVLIIFPLLTCSWANAQNLFKHGQSGFDLSGGVLFQSDMTSTTITPSYSVASICDFGVSVGRAFAKNDPYSSLLTANSISPIIGIQLLKQKRRVPVSFTVAASYEFVKFLSSSHGRMEFPTQGRTLGISGSLYSEILLFNKVGLIPLVGISRYDATITVEHRYPNRTDSERLTQLVYTFGLGFKLLHRNGNFTYIAPQYMYSNEFKSRAIGVALGIGIPLKNADSPKSSNATQNQQVEHLLENCLEIERTADNLLVFTVKNNTIFAIGDTFPLVKRKHKRLKTIGSATVIAVQGEKIVLKYTLKNPNYSLGRNVFIKYR